MAAKKPTPPRTTPGNTYSSAPPPKPNPRIVRRYKVKPPKIGPGLVLRKRGGGLGYVTVRKPTKAPKAAAPPAPPPGPYDSYKGIPGAIESLTQIDRDQAAHQDYAGKVADWLKGALTGLTGVDPAHPGINQTLQQQYLGNVQGVVGGALNAAAAGAIGPAITPTTPGGIAASPTSYLSGAAAQGDFGRAAAALQGAQIQSSLNTLQPNLAAQGYEYQLAAIQQGLPEVYARKRAERRSAIDQFIAKSAADAETIRHHKVQEATSAYNAQAAAAAAYGRLGLSAADQGFDQATQTTAAATPAPAGYVRDPATGKLYRDPNVPQATSTKPKTPKAAGQYDPNTLAKQGFVGGWRAKPKKLPAGAKSGYVQGTDGKWYVKPGTAKGGRAPTATQIAKAQGTEPNKVYDKVNGYVIQGAIADDQKTGTGDLLRILRSLQPTDKKNFARWYSSIIPVLRRIDPRYEEWMTGYIKRRKAGTGGVGWSGKL